MIYSPTTTTISMIKLEHQELSVASNPLEHVESPQLSYLKRMSRHQSAFAYRSDRKSNKHIVGRGRKITARPFFVPQAVSCDSLPRSRLIAK